MTSAFMLLLVVLTCCGLSVNCQDYIFKEPGTITELSLTNSSNTTYLIKAPIGQKIQLTIHSFHFEPCKLETSNLIIEKTNEACLNNHHIIIKNQQGNLEDEFYKKIMQNSTEWIFCDCNRPYKKYLSLSNELSISNVMIETLTDMKQSYNLDFKFLASEFSKSGEIRVVQDAEKLSPVNGYLHTVRVPANHHLRLFGRSNKCKMPLHTVISKNSTNGLFNVNNKIVALNSTEFTLNNCSFLFDLNEPQIFPKSDWYVQWFLKFKDSFDLNDFEIHWSFINNQLTNEKKAQTIELPLQYGFNINDELNFDFTSTYPKRSYLIKLASAENRLGVFNDRSYVKSKATGQPDLFLPILSRNYKSTHELTRFTGALTVSRNTDWSMSIEFTLTLNIGDCDFDESLCGYTNQLETDGTNVFDLTKSYEILHLPKYQSLDAYSQMNSRKNFYLGVKKNNSNAPAVMYSPLIRVQNKKNVDRIQDSINNKPVLISFSYLQQSQSDKLELGIVSQRTDVRETLLSTSPGNFLLEINSAGFPVNEQLDTDSTECLEFKDTNVWRRVEKMSVFSCYDFHLQFNFHHGPESSNTTLGLDNVEINYGDDDLQSCNDLGKCSNNGQCYEFNNKPICCCYPGFTGSDCNTEINPCDQVTCRNEGQCQSTGLYEYQCSCAPGYTGLHCETEINECDSNPCGQNGICYDKIGSYMCSCHAGYSGKNCNERSEYCNSCNDEGTLNCFEDGALNVVCQCKEGYTGSICDSQINECVSNPCFFGSECIDKINDFECKCPSDRTGKLCHIKISNCEREEYKNYCLNNGTCLDEVDDNVRCACPYNFTGEFCETPILTTNCETNPCNNGTCIEEPMGYRCDCPKGMIGKNCDSKPDYPCFGNKCQNGHCFSLDDSDDYMCKCFDNFSGEFCEKQDCGLENIEEFCVKNNTAEIVKDKRFHDTLECKCMCKNGFMGERCEERIDLCYVIDGLMVQMSEYGVEGSGEYCKNGGVCFHDQDSKIAKCNCKEGFEGHRCEEKTLNACLHEPCKFGKCSSSSLNPDEYTCECSNGWEGKNCDEQRVCSIENDCAGNNTVSAKFSFADNRCICQCKIGFEGNNCEINHDDCSNLSEKHMCKNGGKCVDKVASYDCECPKEYGGFYCETKLKACAMKPCVNGECEVDNFSEFKCKCDPGFTGPLCDTQVNNCEPNICENGAKCHNLIANVNATTNGFFCDCPAEFGPSSPTCSYRTIDPCALSPCSNNAECTSSSEFQTESNSKVLVYTDFRCKCPKDFEGEFCEKQITSCSHNPCKNRGLCRVTTDHHFECKCFPAFTGKFCEHQADQCASFPCSNGGTCMPTPEGFKCQCPNMFKGKECDTAVDPCELMNCSNDGKCLTDDNNIPFCECTNKRYTGTQCEIDLTQFTNVTRAVKSEALLNSNEKLKCPILGVETATIDYLFLTVIITLVVIMIIGAIYVYVQLRIKKFKTYMKKVNNDMEITSEISQLSNRSK